MRSFSYKHLAYYRLINYEIHKIMFNVSKNCLLHKPSCVTHKCLKSFMGTSKFALFKRNFYRTHSVRLSNTDSNSSTLNPIEELQKFVGEYATFRLLHNFKTNMFSLRPLCEIEQNFTQYLYCN